MRIYMAGIFAMGFQIACQQSFMALGQAKVSLLLACLRKIILLIPLIFILPHLLPNPVFGVFLAEPSATFWPRPSPPSPSLPGSIKFWIRVRRGCNRCFQSLQTCCVRLQLFCFAGRCSLLRLPAFRRAVPLPAPPEPLPETF